MKYWEIIAGNLSKAGWSWGCVSPVDSRGERYFKTDTKGTSQFGLSAEGGAKVDPALVLPDKEGEPYTVRYDAVNAMLLNEFLKEHRKVEKLEARVAQQHKDFEAAVAELKGQIQQVSAQLAAASRSDGGLEASKSAAQTEIGRASCREGV